MAGGGSLPEPKVTRMPLSPDDRSPVRRKKGSYADFSTDRKGRESTILSDILNGSQGFLGA